jgi:hypothetical protein
MTPEGLAFFQECLIEDRLRKRPTSDVRHWAKTFNANHKSRTKN